MPEVSPFLAGGMAETELAEAVRQARGKPQVLAAVDELYRLLEGEITARRPYKEGGRS